MQARQKQNKVLITQSLLSSWLYMWDCAEGYEDKAKESFLQTLNRVQTETTKAQQRGIDFEDAVYACAKDWRDDYDGAVKEIAKIVRGGQFQVRAYKEATVQGVRCLFMAKCDAVKCGEIYDIKRVGQYEVGKYLNSPQHPEYFFCIPEAHKFTYLVCDDSKSVYMETYYPKETALITDIAEQFFNYLKQENLFDLFLEKWQAL